MRRIEGPHIFFFVIKYTLMQKLKYGGAIAMFGKHTVISGVCRRYSNCVRERRLQAMISSQKQLSDLTGIPRNAISLIENNHMFLSSPYALLIAEALGCSINDLFKRIK
ncbi:MAG: helix-turn-helix transcriptional regulator [Armatimonadota bacterium]